MKPMKLIILEDKHKMFTATYKYYPDSCIADVFIEHHYSGLKNLVTDLTLSYTELDVECTDTFPVLAFILSNYLRTYEFLADEFYEYAHLEPLLDMTMYDVDLFGAETYNGWDIHEYAESQGIDYKYALFELFMYATAKLMLHLHLRYNK